jgi:hypothetical protein
LQIISYAIIIIIEDKNETHAGKKKSKEISQARIGKYCAASKFFSHMLIDIELEFGVLISR